MKKAILIILIVFATNIYAQTNHPIIGTWQLESVIENGETHTGMQAVWIFEKGGNLKAARSLSGALIPVGKWKCDKKRKMLIMESTMDKDFNGEAKVLNLKDGKLSYKKDGATLNFKKAEMVKPDNTPIPALKFTYEDFIGSNDEEKYPEDTAKLPWTIDQIYAGLKNVKEMVYHVDHFVPKRGKTDSWTNSYKVKYHSDKEMGIREYSYFQKDYVDMDDCIFPLNDNTMGQKEFFPQEKPDYFRVVGTEDIKTDLGTFKCTIVEGLGNFDLKLKYWMINDKPGIFAKIIKSKEKDNPFDYTNVYTLKEIK